MNRLDKALDDFFDKDSKLSFSDKFSNLRQAYMWNAINSMRKIQKNGIGSPISDDESYKQVEGMKQFKVLEKLYMSELKTNKMSGISDVETDRMFMEKIKAHKDTIGDVVRDSN